MNCTSKVTCPPDSSSSLVLWEDPIPSPPLLPLVNDEIKQYLDILVNIVFLTGTSLLGVVTNVVNVVIFWKQGLKDSITIGFFALSISDFVLVVMSLVTSSCYIAKTVLPNSDIDFSSVHYVSSGSLKNMGYSFSVILTAFLSVERCCCVVVPFKVKFIFTRSRTIAILLSILAVHVICYAPFFATQGLRWKESLTTNNTVTYKLVVHFTQNRPVVERFNYILFLIITPSFSQVIVTLCAAILIVGLRRSSDFRKATSGSKPNSTARESTKNATISGDTNEPIEGGGDDKLSYRDARLVRTMVFLVAILSISNIPFLAILCAQTLIPELNMGKAYQNTFTLSHSIVYVLSSVNASVNLFVYYNNSQRYREIFQSVFRSGKLN